VQQYVKIGDAALKNSLDIEEDDAAWMWSALFLPAASPQGPLTTTSGLFVLLVKSIGAAW